jgi:2Fe-2S iron-sulfur cluster protein
MSDIFRAYERLIPITVLGRTFEVPEKNSLLRAFQYVSPETIPYGRFCWNQECQYCKVTCKLPDDDEARPMLACKFLVVPGMEVTELSPELKWCLSRKLGQGELPQPPAVEGPPSANAEELSQP